MRRTILTGLVLAMTLAAQDVRFVGKTKYLNNARAVVTHTIDDSTKWVPASVDVDELISELERLAHELQVDVTRLD